MIKKRIKEYYILGIRIGFLKAFELIRGGKRINNIENQNTELITINMKNGSPIFLRQFSSDISIFNAIFNDLEYDFKVDFIPKNIIDCGANIGLTSLFFKIKFQESTILAIEPEPNNYKILEKNIESYKGIIGINAGVWSSLGELQISDDSSTGWAVETTLKKDINSKGFTISAFSINDLMNKYSFDYIDILKIDVEGSEKQIFRENYSHWLPKTRILVIELHNMIDKKISAIFFKALNEYDFDVHFKGENLICYNRKFQYNDK